MKVKILIILGLLLTLKQGLAFWHLIKSGERLKEAQVELNSLQKENQILSEKLSWVDNPEFIEKEARDKLGFGREGETVLIVPDQNKDSRSQILDASDEVPNWRKWWDLYIRI